MKVTKLPWTLMPTLQKPALFLRVLVEYQHLSWTKLLSKRRPRNRLVVAALVVTARCPDVIRLWNFQGKKVSRKHFFCPVKWSHASRSICCVFNLICDLLYFVLLCSLFTVYLFRCAVLYFVFSDFLTVLLLACHVLATTLTQLLRLNPQISSKQVHSRRQLISMLQK